MPLVYEVIRRPTVDALTEELNRRGLQAITNTTPFFFTPNEAGEANWLCILEKYVTEPLRRIPEVEEEQVDDVEEE